MNRIKRRKIVLGLLISLGLPLWAHTEATDFTGVSDTTDVRYRELEEVRVEGHKGEGLTVSGYRLVATMTADEVQLLPVKTVADVLQYIPGVDVRQRGASGVQMDPSIRGGSAKQVKVLLNGIDMTDPQTEHYSMDIPVDALMIERIEVLQGTNYAIDAFSGAINIVTKGDTGDRLRVTGQLTVGEYGLANPEVAVKVHKNDWYLNGSASYNGSEGYASNTDYHIVNAFV